MDDTCTCRQTTMIFVLGRSNPPTIMARLGLFLLLLVQSTSAVHSAFVRYPWDEKHIECNYEKKKPTITVEKTTTLADIPIQLDRRQIMASFLFLSSPATLYRPLHAAALTVEEAETSYDKYAKKYDELDGGNASNILGIDEARSILFSQAQGAVLEIGAGTGLNLEKYDLKKIRSLTLVDISEGMLKEAQKRASSLGGFSAVPIEFIKADATSELYQRFGERSFDTVVDSFSLCVMGNEGAKRCLDQMRTVVKTKEDGGQILLLENSRSSNPILGMYQDATADAASTMGGKGCVYNQDVGSLIRSTQGMSIEKEEMYAAGLFRSFRCTVQ